MKFKILAGIFLAQVAFIQVATATETTLIPTQEKEFVDAINGLNKAKIVAQFGEPAKADDVRIKGSNKVVASIWQYHLINTAADGTYYETTELDFIDDKVVTVVFLNNDGSEKTDGAQTYQVPTKGPDL